MANIISTACNEKLCALDKSIYQIYAIRRYLPQILNSILQPKIQFFGFSTLYTQNWLSEHIFWLNENNRTNPNLCNTACSMLIHFFSAGNEKIIENRIREILWGLLKFMSMSMCSSFEQQSIDFDLYRVRWKTFYPILDFSILVCFGIGAICLSSGFLWNSIQAEHESNVYRMAPGLPIWLCDVTHVHCSRKLQLWTVHFGSRNYEWKTEIG